MKWAAVGLVLICACSGSRTPAPPEPKRDAPLAIGDSGVPQPAASGDTQTKENAKETRAVARTLAQVSELRGIASTRVVPGVKLERDQLVARIKDKALREYPPEALRREGQLLQILGFAPPTFDYLGEMMKLLEAQLEGFYEPKNGTMYLAADLKGEQAKATLAHELVHALQDQRWDLKTRSTYKPGHGDESMALSALAEGDATSLMLDFMMRPEKTALDVPDPMLRELMKSGVAMGDIQSVPHILRTTLISPYVEGLAFVHALRRKGGWDAVNKAWDRTPTTTEQILHLDKWEQDEGPLPVAVPTAQTLGADWRRTDEDTFGELGFALTYGEWMEGDDGHAIAAGWGGDKSAVWQKDDAIAFVVHERYDEKPANLAAGAMAKLVPALKKSLGKASVEDKTSICFERKETGPLLFARKDREIVLVAGPAKVEGTTWTSASTCAVAKKWAQEVLAQK